MATQVNLFAPATTRTYPHCGGCGRGRGIAGGGGACGPSWLGPGPFFFRKCMIPNAVPSRQGGKKKIHAPMAAANKR
nr:Uncharacterised protein [Streptococcus thermophilus]